MQNRFKSSSLINKKISNRIIKYKEINKFNFEKGLISKNDEKNKFVNFARENGEAVYNLVIDYYISYLNNDYSFLKEFIVDELTPGYRVDRLFRILNFFHKIKYSTKDTPHIIKLKNINDKRLHFYIRVSRENCTLILIDLYHLAIYGSHFQNGKEYVIPIDKIYKHNKENKINLSDIKVLNDNNQAKELEAVSN